MILRATNGPGNTHVESGVSPPRDLTALPAERMPGKRAGDQDARVKQQPHGSGNGRRRKSSGSGSSKSLATWLTSVLIPRLRRNFAPALRSSPPRARCGTRSRIGLPLRVTTTVSPFSATCSYHARRLAVRQDGLAIVAANIKSVSSKPTRSGEPGHRAVKKFYKHCFWVPAFAPGCPENSPV